MLRAKGMDLAMGWTQVNLSVLGVWPEPRKTTRWWRVASGLIFWSTCFVTFSFICAPESVNLILESTSLDRAIENLSISVPAVFALVKQIVLRYHQRALTLLVNQILVDWGDHITDSDRDTMLKSAKISRMISIVCSTLTYLMLFAFISFQIYSNIQSGSENALGGLLHFGTFPYDTQRSPNFEITWVAQLIGTALMCIAYSCFDTFLAVLVLHLCGQLAVLRVALRNIADYASGCNYTQFQQRLGCIVDRHDQLHKYAIIVEDCFNFTLLVQTLISTAMFCLTAYRLITTVADNTQSLSVFGGAFYVSHVMYTMLHLYIYCYVGEALLTESTGIADSVYECDWYNLPPKKATALIMVIHRARISFRITAGKFSTFSLAFYGTILRTSAGYLSVLLAMKDQLVEEE